MIAVIPIAFRLNFTRSSLINEVDYKVCLNDPLLGRDLMLQQFIFLVLFIAALTAGPLSYAGEVNIGGFGEVGLTNSSGIMGEDNKTQFFQGAIDLYFTAKIGEKANFLSEIVFETDETNTAILDVERLGIQYHVSPWFMIVAGRVHTALGYWNDTFHHGSWLQTPVTRPLMYNFEDMNGVLPVHATGLEFRGEGRLGIGNLGYIANIANGRGPMVDPPQVVGDADNSKALNAVLYYTFPTLGNLRVGGTVYRDTLPGGFDETGAELPKGTELIYGGHLVWSPEKFELIGEILQMAHTYASENPDSRLLMGYVQGYYQLFEEWRPYFRAEYLGVRDAADAYTGIGSGANAYTMGVRYDLSYSSALKLELARVKNVNKDMFGTNFNLNWSFGF